MADTKAIGKLVTQLNKQIESGVKLFKYYKEISKDFQNRQKNFMNNEESKKIFANLKQKYDEEEKILKAQRNATSSPEMKELPNRIKAKQYANATAKLKILKKNYENKLIKHKEAHKKLSDMYLVNSEKMFLKEKEKIRVEKKEILSNILEIGKQIKSYMSVEEFNDFIKRIYKRRYEVLDNKTISFKTLLHHLESGQVSENVSKTTKNIDQLMTIGNVVNRKKNMNIGIKQKEIEYWSKEYEKINKLSKNSEEKEIKKLVKSLNGISDKTEKERITTKIDQLSKSLKNKIRKQKQIKRELKLKEKQLKKLQKSS